MKVTELKTLKIVISKEENNKYDIVNVNEVNEINKDNLIKYIQVFNIISVVKYSVYFLEDEYLIIADVEIKI